MKASNHTIGNVAIFIVVFLMHTSCRKATIPFVITGEVTNITTVSATINGHVTSDGGSELTSRGICWSSNHTPTTFDNTTTEENEIDNFFCNITGLEPNTRYYARAYATNKKGTAYGEVVSFTTEYETITDEQGNTYKIVAIGSQTWMAENLKTTKFNDNTDIPLVTDDTIWSNITTPAYCWYNNDQETYGNTYGILYNYYAVNTHKLCPAGWHIPDNAEWNNLIENLGGESVAGGKLKETGTSKWLSPNTGATNESGFTALPGGYRHYDFLFMNIGNAGYWWSSSNVSFSVAYYYSIYYGYPSIFQNQSYVQFGYSVRCLKD